MGLEEMTGWFETVAEDRTSREEAERFYRGLAMSAIVIFYLWKKKRSLF